MPGQSIRKKSVRQKLNVIELEVRNKVVLLVEDSIVRGTTIREVIEQCRQAGARKVYLASAAPPDRYPNVFGIDMPSKDEFIATGRSEKEIEQSLGVELLVYQKLEDLKRVVSSWNEEIEEFDCSVFDGRYNCIGVDESYLSQLSLERNDYTRSIEDVFEIESGDEHSTNSHVNA
jgi:amidophosphoribosyltransferase